MTMARECYECGDHLAVVRVSLQPKFASPELQWLCAECACDALQDWLLHSQWHDIESVMLLRL